MHPVESAERAGDVEETKSISAHWEQAEEMDSFLSSCVDSQHAVQEDTSGTAVFGSHCSERQRQR